eukprot:12390383-Alexandrium_andersonii.AAC.1
MGCSSANGHSHRTDACWTDAALLALVSLASGVNSAWMHTLCRQGQTACFGFDGGRAWSACKGWHTHMDTSGTHAWKFPRSPDDILGYVLKHVDVVAVQIPTCTHWRGDDTKRE